MLEDPLSLNRNTWKFRSQSFRLLLSKCHIYTLSQTQRIPFANRDMSTTTATTNVDEDDDDDDDGAPRRRRSSFSRQAVSPWEQYSLIVSVFLKNESKPTFTNNFYPAPAHLPPTLPSSLLLPPSSSFAFCPSFSA